MLELPSLLLDSQIGIVFGVPCEGPSESGPPSCALASKANNKPTKNKAVQPYKILFTMVFSSSVNGVENVWPLSKRGIIWVFRESENSGLTTSRQLRGLMMQTIM